jgi:hypothetical protein
LGHELESLRGLNRGVVNAAGFVNIRDYKFTHPQILANPATSHPMPHEVQLARRRHKSVLQHFADSLPPKLKRATTGIQDSFGWWDFNRQSTV